VSQERECQGGVEQEKILQGQNKEEEEAEEEARCLFELILQ
jgi:hypothetical protein